MPALLAAFLDRSRRHDMRRDAEYRRYGAVSSGARVVLLATVLAAAALLVPAGANAATVTGMSPTGGPLLGGTPVTFTGAGLDTVTSASFGAGREGAITSKTPSTLTVTSPAGQFPGGVTLNVSASGVSIYQANYDYWKMVDSFSPTNGPETGGTSVTFSGRSLDTVTDVTFGSGGSAVITDQSASSLTVTTPRATSTGGTSVSMTSTSGIPDTPYGFNYDDVLTPPSLASLTPNRGPVAGGNTVTIDGGWLNTVQSVKVGGAAAAISAKSFTSLTFTAPAGTAGTAMVTVTNDEGESSTSYVYDAPPSPDPAPDPTSTHDPGTTPPPAPSPDTNRAPSLPRVDLPGLLPGGPPLAGTPELSATRLSRKSFAAGARVEFSLTSSQAGTARVVISKRSSGRRAAGKCKAPTTKKTARKQAKKCTYDKVVATLTASAASGTSTIPFNGKVGRKSKKLAPGKYKATITVTAASGISSKPTVIRFKIKAPKKKA